MSSTQIIKCAPCYELKPDEKLDNLRDLTWYELKTQYGKNNKVRCNCWCDRTREYKVDSAFVSSHMKSQRHVNWREEQIKKHKQEFGHCISSEKKSETLTKENREYKKQVIKLTETITSKEEKLVLMSKKIDDLTDENKVIKEELEKYEQDTISLTKERDRLKQEFSNYNSTISSRRKLTIKPPLRAFR